MRRLLALLVLLISATTAVPLLAQSSERAAAASAARWILSQQQADGSFPGFDAGGTADAVLALVAAGSPVPASALRYLEGQAASYATSAGKAGKLSLAVRAAGRDPRTFGTLDLVAQIEQSYDRATGLYSPQLFEHALALLALKGAGVSVPPAAVNALVKAQLANGGWSFDGAGATGSDTNTTALAIQALVAIGQGQGDAVARGLAYLQAVQNDDGGFPYQNPSQFGTDSDANSTAIVLQALAATGADRSEALKALLALQNASGAFRYQAGQPDDNALATYQAVPGLLGKPFPLAAAATPTSLPATGAPAPAGIAVLVAGALLALVAGQLLRHRGS